MRFVKGNDEFAKFLQDNAQVDQGGIAILSQAAELLKHGSCLLTLDELLIEYLSEVLLKWNNGFSGNFSFFVIK